MTHIRVLLFAIDLCFLIHIMASEADEATRLNNEARKLFDEGKFEDAGKLYERANEADTLNSPIYLSNLALVYLKLKQFEKAEICATIALSRDPRFIKARYRRAMARWRRGRPMEALVDLASVLTLDPMDKAAVAAFETVSNEYESLGDSRSSLDPMQILRADFPSPYGSAAAPRPRTAQNVSRANGVVIPDISSRMPKKSRAGTCASCGTIQWTRDKVKTCQGCSTACYCDELCQRKHWPTHKKDCIPYDEAHVLTMHLCRNLMVHKYIHMHLTFYAMRSIGALHYSPPPYFTVLLLFVELVPMDDGPRPRRRIHIRNIITAPLAVFYDKLRESYYVQREQMRKTCGTPNASGVAILVTPFLERGHEKNKSRTAIFMNRLIPDFGLLVKNSFFPVGVQSHSFGVGRKLTDDLDELYWSLEDELANDVDNYYGLQR
ncbi:RNA polymerase II-associated protein 3 [Mycena sanguinolenta]|uniref:RNA polymerase II-associated protein 3 n=1 Tax=Mycena sanguinolenta TaxID=230812 RepID=A0A8H6YF25_9AGAR|nr:RNA polymerase II-associated protein 3 [Mycena sanguinolenta]